MEHCLEWCFKWRFCLIVNSYIFGPNIRDVNTALKMKFFIKDFFSKCDQIQSFFWIWSHLLKKSLMENFIFYVV